VPPYTGHKPPRMRNSDDFPHPFGPTTSKWSPGFNEKDSALTRTSPFGDIIGLLAVSDVYLQSEKPSYTSINSISSLSMTFPRPRRTAAFSSVLAEETSFFSKWPA
jgi:hypothetical protein